MKRAMLVLVGVVVTALLLSIACFLVSIVANAMSVHNHMEQVNQEVLSLAQQLGYTPDTLLRHVEGIRDVSLGPPFNARCMNRICFETPMTVAKFTERLNTVAPSAIAEGKEENWTELFQNFEFDVEHADSAEAQALLKRKRQTAYLWRLPDGGANFTFYDMLNLPATFTYKGRPITGNVVEIYENGGWFLLGLGCPGEFIEP